MNVVARDKAGAESLVVARRSTFATGTPAASTCSVRLTNASDWGNGYVGSVDITNTGAVPVDGWTLGLHLARPWQSFGSGWNGTWTADGARGHGDQRGLERARSHPAPRSTSGSSATTPARTSCRPLFTLNGTLCTTAP